MDRRKALVILTNGGGLIAAGAVGAASMVTALSPVLQEPAGEVWRPLGPVDNFPTGEVRQAVVEIPRDDWAASLRQLAVYVWRPDDNQAVVFSRNCTDLSCPVTWDAGSGWFFCPCHGGIFNKSGEPVAGPPSRPLYRYANRIRDGVLEIDLNSLPPMT